MKTPYLKKIDLRKIITSEDDYVSHPDMKVGCWYLVKLNDEYAVGRCIKEWYGLCILSDPIDFCIDDSDIKGIFQIKSR